MSKQCRRCLREMPLENFHRQSTGRMGRHSWCRDCVNQYNRETRHPPVQAAKRMKWNLSRRYGLTLAAFEQMRQAQGNLCAICDTPMGKPKVDHCHATGQVRGLLCHRCNLRLSGIEDVAFRQRAEAYLQLTSSAPASLARTGP